MKSNERDAQLRESMLNHTRLLGSRESDGCTAASKLAIVARDADRVGVDDEAHAARLIDELVEWGLLSEKPLQGTTGNSTRGDLRYRRVRITDLEWKRFTGQIDPIPGVADRRAE